MARPRVTIAGLMAVVLYAALSFAALANASAVWADTTYTIAILTVSTALLGAIVRKGPNRVPWVGFAVFGWIYVLIDLLPGWFHSGFGMGNTTRPNLMIVWAIDRLAPLVNRNPDLSIFDRISYSLGMMAFGLIGAALAPVLATKHDDLDVRRS
jgi:hypothetical protein